MSKYNLPTIPLADRQIAQSPMLGGNVAIYLSPEPAFLVAEIQADADESGKLELNVTHTLPATPAGADLQIVTLESLKATDPNADPVITLEAEDNTDPAVAMQGTATFSVPGHSHMTSRIWQPGWALDVAPAVTGKLFTKITSKSTDGAGTEALGLSGIPRGARLRIYQLPDIASFVLLGCTSDYRYPSPARQPKSILCGMDSSAFTVPGLKPEQSFSFNFKHKSFAQAPNRLDGIQNGCLMALFKHGGVLSSDRIVNVGVNLNIEYNNPEGDNEANGTVNGIVEDSLFFVAS